MYYTLAQHESAKKEYFILMHLHFLFPSRLTALFFRSLFVINTL